MEWNEIIVIVVVCRGKGRGSEMLMGYFFKSFVFENCTEEQASFLGNGVKHKISARALGYISIGHTKHHLNIIRERYLNN